MKTNILINNELLQGDSTPEKIINPVNSELIVEVPQSSTKQVDKAVSAAKKAFATSVYHSRSSAVNSFTAGTAELFISKTVLRSFFSIDRICT